MELKSQIRGLTACIANLACFFSLLGLASPNNIPIITKEELKPLLGKGEITILDVRMDVEWQSSNSKIKGAVWEDPREVHIWANKYPKDKTLVLYCA